MQRFKRIRQMKRINTQKLITSVGTFNAKKFGKHHRGSVFLENVSVEKTENGYCVESTYVLGKPKTVKYLTPNSNRRTPNTTKFCIYQSKPFRRS